MLPQRRPLGGSGRGSDVLIRAIRCHYAPVRAAIPVILRPHPRVITPPPAGTFPLSRHCRERHDLRADLSNVLCGNPVNDGVRGAGRREAAMDRARVLLAEDHADVAAQLRTLLEPEFEVVTTVGDGYAMLGAARALRPDVIVADIAMPLLDGMTAAAELLREEPEARIVFLSVHRDAALVQRCLTL